MGTTIEQGHFEKEVSAVYRYASSPAPSWGGIPGPGPAQSPSLASSIGLSSPAGSEVSHPPSQAQPSPLQPKSPYPAKYAGLKRMSSSASTAQYTSDLDIAGMFACTCSFVILSYHSCMPDTRAQFCSNWNTSS